jgi:hypothetical protein
MSIVRKKKIKEFIINIIGYYFMLFTNRGWKKEINVFFNLKDKAFSIR